MHATEKVQVQAPPDQLDEFPEPKVEAWTSQFLKKSLVTKSRLSAPDPPTLSKQSSHIYRITITRAKRLEAENYKKQLLLQKSDVLKQQAMAKTKLIDEFSIVATPPAPTKTVTPTDPLEGVGRVVKELLPAFPSLTISNLFLPLHQNHAYHVLLPKLRTPAR